MKLTDFWEENKDIVWLIIVAIIGGLIIISSL